IGAGEQADAGLKGTYQDELTIGVDRQFGATFSIGLKATYRRLGRMIEDRCDLDPRQNGGVSCAFINPGSKGRYATGDFYSCTGLDNVNNCSLDPAEYRPLYGTDATPRAKRLYRGIEILAREVISSSFWLQASYV